MCKKKYYKEWYEKNRDRLLSIRRKRNKKYNASKKGKEAERLRNASPERKAYRKQYKKTLNGRRTNLKYRRNPEVKKRYEDYRIKKRYGITTKEYWELVAKQNGKCAICSKSDGKKLHIDHNHKTGKIRGLLCGNCNRGIGMFEDNVFLIESAKVYLSK